MTHVEVKRRLSTVGSLLPSVSPGTSQGSRLSYSKFLNLLSHLFTLAIFSSLISDKIICTQKKFYLCKFYVTLITGECLICIPIFSRQQVEGELLRGGI